MRQMENRKERKGEGEKRHIIEGCAYVS